MEEFPQLPPQVLDLIKKLDNKIQCPHGKIKPYFCKDCNGKGICQHNLLRYKCRICRPILKKFKNLKICICNNNNQCEFCINKKKESETCLYKRLSYVSSKLKVDLKCECEDCKIRIKVAEGKICFVCQINPVFRLLRCKQCFQKHFQKISPNPSPPKPQIENEIKLLSTNKSSTILLQELKLPEYRINILNKSCKKIDNVIFIIDNNNKKWLLEYYLNSLFKVFTKFVVKRDNSLQLKIASERLGDIEKILKNSITDESRCLSIRIIWLLICNNTVVMRELVEYGNIMEIIEKWKSDGFSNIETINKINEIFHQLQHYGILKN